MLFPGTRPRESEAMLLSNFPPILHRLLWAFLKTEAIQKWCIGISLFLCQSMYHWVGASRTYFLSWKAVMKLIKLQAWLIKDKFVFYSVDEEATSHRQVFGATVIASI